MLNLDGRNTETESSLVNSPRTANNLLYSGVVHAIAAYILVSTGIQLINLDRKSAQPTASQSISVSLYSKDVLKPIVSTIHLGTRQPLVYYANAVPQIGIQDLVNSLGGIVDLENRITEELKPIHADVIGINQSLQQIIEGNQRINEGLQSLIEVNRENIKKLDSLAEYIKQSFQELRRDIGAMRGLVIDAEKESQLYGGMRVILSQNGDVSQYYSDTFKPEERNERNYIRFFNAYANAYFDLNKPSELILDILKTNSILSHVINATAEINRNGLFKIVQLEAFAGFNDEDRVTLLNHFTGMFDKMPKTFVPPEMAGLQAPYQLSYAVLNPAK